MSLISDLSIVLFLDIILKLFALTDTLLLSSPIDVILLVI